MVRDVPGRSLLGDAKSLISVFAHRNVVPFEMFKASVWSRWIGHDLQETCFLLLDSELEVSKDVGALS